MSSLVDYTVKLKADNEIAAMLLQDKSDRLAIIEARVAKGIGKGVSEGVERLEQRVRCLEESLTEEKAARARDENEGERLRRENRELRVALESACREKGGDLDLVLKVGELTEQVATMQEMSDNYQYLEEEVNILRETDRASKALQSDVEKEFEEFKKIYEDQVAKCISIEAENRDLRTSLDNLQHKVEVQQIEIDQLTSENNTVNSKKVSLFKEKVAEFEEQRTKMIEESEFNAREVERMTSQLKKAEERVKILEQYLLKERHEKNKIQADLESARDQDRQDSKPLEEPVKDYTDYYGKVLVKFDCKSKDQISKRKASSSLVSQTADRLNPEVGKERSRSRPAADQQTKNKKKRDSPLPDLSQVKVASTGSRLQRLEKLTVANDMVQAWLLDSNM